MRRLALLAAFVLLAAACGSGDSEQAAPAGTAPTSTAPPSESEGEIAGESLEGERLSLTDYRGKRVLVNVWSSW